MAAKKSAIVKDEAPVDEQLQSEVPIEQPIEQPVEPVVRKDVPDADAERTKRLHEFDAEERFLRWCYGATCPPSNLPYTMYKAKLDAYKSALLNLPGEPGWPTDVKWPEKPDMSAVTELARKS